MAARLLAELAFGSTSEAYKRLVLQGQKAETLFADVPMNRDPSLFEVTAVVKRPEDLPAVQKLLEETIRRFQADLVAPRQLAKVKQHEKYGFLMRLDSPLRMAEAVAPFISAAGSLEAVDRLYRASDQVTPEDVRRAARKYFTPKRRTIIVLKGNRP